MIFEAYFSRDGHHRTIKVVRLVFELPTALSTPHVVSEALIKMSPPPFYHVSALIILFGLKLAPWTVNYELPVSIGW